MVRYLFEPLALSAAVSIAASYIFAMTLLPAFCARFFREKKKDDSLQSDDRQSTSSSWGYGALLAQGIQKPWLTSFGIVTVAAGCCLLLPRVGTELFPTVDDGVFEIRLRTLPGTRIENTEALVEQIEAAIQEVIPADELMTVLANIGLPVGKGAGFSTILSPNSGPDSAFIVVTLKNTMTRTSTATYVKRLRAELHQRFPREQFLFRQGGMTN